MYGACLHLTEFARNVLSTWLLTHDLLVTARFLFPADRLKLILKPPSPVRKVTAETGTRVPVKRPVRYPVF